MGWYMEFECSCSGISPTSSLDRLMWLWFSLYWSVSSHITSPFAKMMLCCFQDFEKLYYQRNPDRLHFLRQSLHVLVHIAPETKRMGPGCLYSQWTMERTIGNLGQEIRQHATPYANLEEIALRRAQVNAMKAMWPDLEKEKGPPRGYYDAGKGYLMLPAVDRTARVVATTETQAIQRRLVQLGENFADDAVPMIRRWARLLLPNGQVARCLWKEGAKGLQDICMARMVKVRNWCSNLQDTLTKSYSSCTEPNYASLRCYSTSSERSMKACTISHWFISSPHPTPLSCGILQARSLSVHERQRMG